jgi:hypothetical protein
MLENNIRFFLKCQQSDGGFPYGRAGESALEPTAFSLIALSGVEPKSKAGEKGVEYLLSLQNRDGGWLLFRKDNLSSVYATALAVLALRARGRAQDKSSLGEAVFYLKNNHKFAKNVDLDEDIWGWNDYTYVGAEPTAAVVLALKHVGSLPEGRGKEAEKFFTQNTCDEGGWTYGAPVDRNDRLSPSPVSALLRPQLHVTAFVLLAMQDRKEKFRSGIEVIAQEFPKSYCPFSLSLSALAVDCYGKNNRGILERLNRIMAEDQQVKEMAFYHAVSAVANLTSLGKNPLCLNR